MASKTKAAIAAAAAAANVPRLGLSQEEFCAAHSFSEGFYRSLRKKGMGPRETRVLDRVFITIEDCTEWRLKMRELSEQLTSAVEQEAAK